MTTIAPSRRTRTRRRLGILLLAAAALLALLTVLAPAGARADTVTPTPTPTATTGATDGPTAGPTDACTTSATVGCVQGTIRTSGGDPAVGVSISLNGPGLDDVATKTDDAGKWAFTIVEAGSYTLTLDTETLPQGQFLDGEATRTVQAAPFSSAAQVFKLTDTEGGTTTSASSFSWSRFLQQLASGIRLGLMIALASIGLSLLFGTTGLSNFAQGEQVTLGGLLAFTFANTLGLNLWVAGILAVLLCAATGYIQDAIIWRPLRRKRLSLTQMMIVSIGLSVALSFLFQMIYGAATVRIDTSAPQSVDLFGIRLTVQSYIAMGIAVLVLLGVGLALLYTRIGRATRAISDNSALASASGIDVDRVIRLVWTVSAGLAGLAGVLLGLVLNGLSWFTGGQILLLMFAAVTLGGLGTAFGALVGSMIIGIVVELTNLVLPGDFKYATALLVLIVILLVRPQGIFGRRERIG